MKDEMPLREVLDAVGVVEKGFCIGCGACTVASSEATIQFNGYGELTARFKDVPATQYPKLDRACPFSSTAPTESELAKEVFGSEITQIGAEVGYFSGLYAAYSHAHRSSGSSGGIVSWVLAKLLESQKVDKVIVVGRAPDGDRFFDFKVIERVEDLGGAATSFYYPVSYDRVLQYVLENPGRYAITGVPCFHKALRQLKREYPVLRERIPYQIGIVCGQMKSAFYLEYLARRAGLPGPADNACFRRKNDTARADEYDFEASTTLASGEKIVRRVGNRQIGANWGMGLFKPQACDFCDDVFAETADIAVMDAWLAKYISDGLGTSLVVARKPDLQKMLDAEMQKPTELWVEAVSEDDVMESQRGGLNHRRAGLRYRLARFASKAALPRKRVQPDSKFGIFFKLEQLLRTRLREQSRIALREQVESTRPGLEIYDSRMWFSLWLYRWLYRLKSRFAKVSNYRKYFRLDC